MDPERKFNGIEDVAEPVDLPDAFIETENSPKDPLVLLSDANDQKWADREFLADLFDAIQDMSHHKARRVLEVFSHSEHLSDIPQDTMNVLCEKILAIKVCQQMILIGEVLREKI